MDDVASSLADLDAARAAEQEALAVLRAAESEVAGARRAFTASPSAEGEQAVEVAEREQRRAQRYAEARAAAHSRAEQLHAETCRAAALVRLAELEREHASDVVDEAGVIIGEFAELYEQVAALVERAHALAARDSAIVASAHRSAAEAGVQSASRPLTLRTLRTAVGSKLFSEWNFPEFFEVDRPSGEFQRLVDLLASEPGTAAERRARLHRVTQAALDLFGGVEAGAWFLLCTPPTWNAGGTYSTHYAEALRLLRAIDALPDATTNEGENHDPEQRFEVQRSAS